MVMLQHLFDFLIILCTAFLYRLSCRSDFRNPCQLCRTLHDNRYRSQLQYAAQYINVLLQFLCFFCFSLTQCAVQLHQHLRYHIGGSCHGTACPQSIAIADFGIRTDQQIKIIPLRKLCVCLQIFFLTTAVLQTAKVFYHSQTSHDHCA